MAQLSERISGIKEEYRSIIQKVSNDAKSRKQLDNEKIEKLENQI